MRVILTAALLALGASTAPGLAQSADERLYSCETSLAGERTRINYLRDAAFVKNVGVLEKRFSGFGKVSCPGYVTLREILRRNGMEDDGSYCLLWDKANDTYVGVQVGARKGNALCRKSFCQRVNTTKAATFNGANAVATAGFEAIRQRPGATIISATSGGLAGTLEGAAAVASGIASSPVAAGAVIVGGAAAAGAVWYCADTPEAAVEPEAPLPEPEPFIPDPDQSDDGPVWTSTLPEPE